MVCAFRYSGRWVAVPHAFLLKAVGETRSASSSNMMSSRSSQLLTTKRKRDVHHSGDWRRTQEIYLHWREPAGLAGKQRRSLVPRDTAQASEKSPGGMTLGAEGTEHGNEICVIR